YLDRLAEQTLTALGGADTLQDRVRGVLFSELSEGVPPLDRVGRALGMSARRLQRGLRLEGTTFAAVLTQLRQDMAGPLLRDGQLSVAEGAFLLGYQDPRPFPRAFPRGCGGSPPAYPPPPRQATPRPHPA